MGIKKYKTLIEELISDLEKLDHKTSDDLFIKCIFENILEDDDNEKSLNSFCVVENFYEVVRNIRSIFLYYEGIAFEESDTFIKKHLELEE